MAFPVSNQYRREAFDQNSPGKSGQGFMGQRSTGNRGSLFLLRNFGKGGLEPANHERGQEPANFKDDDLVFRPPFRSKAAKLSAHSYELYDVGARGAKELGWLCPGNNSRDEAHTPFLSPTSSHTHTNTNTNTPIHIHTHTCTKRRLVCFSDRQGLLRFPASLGILLLPAPPPSLLPGILCMLHVQSLLNSLPFPVRVTSFLSV